jgi:hypothetical protein
MTQTAMAITFFILSGFLGIIGYLYSQLQKSRKECAESKIALSEKDINYLVEKIDDMKDDMQKGFDKIDQALSKYMTKEQVVNLINAKTNLFKEILVKDVTNIIAEARGMKTQIRTTFSASMILVGYLVNSLTKSNTKVSLKVIKAFNDVLKDNNIKIAELENEDDIENLVKKIVPEIVPD